MASLDSLRLVPSLYEKGGEEDFVKSGRTLSMTLSPRDNSIAVYTAPSVEPRALQALSITYPKEQDIYTASADPIPSSERRLFITDTSVIFAALQNLVKSANERDPGLLRDEQTLRLTTKLTVDYVSFIKECWVHASQPVTRPEPLQFEADHYRTLYTSLSLFVVLYMVENGLEDAPVGEELMEWLNIHFIEPSSEEGDNLSSQDRPWEDETFWPYLTRLGFITSISVRR
ncbi:hypothetical protein EVG20_g564 [Dentipellis fragilis]|uniref:Nuclear pore complex protein Nup85 n=1 Tax=Dentipellis fragilis TaxID=205917 RepID=A0A4Y9ZF21_9AGAM|nr:hypothetical protein EVG20_g564 [Dentipellis fragilis]